MRIVQHLDTPIALDTILSEPLIYHKDSRVYMHNGDWFVSSITPNISPTDMVESVEFVLEKAVEFNSPVGIQPCN